MRYNPLDIAAHVRQYRRRPDAPRQCYVLTQHTRRLSQRVGIVHNVHVYQPRSFSLFQRA